MLGDGPGRADSAVEDAWSGPARFGFRLQMWSKSVLEGIRTRRWRTGGRVSKICCFVVVTGIDAAAWFPGEGLCGCFGAVVSPRADKEMKIVVEGVRYSGWGRTSLCHRLRKRGG